MIEPPNEIVGYAIVQTVDEFHKALEKFGETAHNIDSSDAPNEFPAQVLFIISTYNGDRTLNVHHRILRRIPAVLVFGEGYVS